MGTEEGQRRTVPPVFHLLSSSSSSAGPEHSHGVTRPKGPRNFPFFLFVCLSFFFLLLSVFLFFFLSLFLIQGLPPESSSGCRSVLVMLLPPLVSSCACLSGHRPALHLLHLPTRAMKGIHPRTPVRRTVTPLWAAHVPLAAPHFSSAHRPPRPLPFPIFID